MATTSRMMDGQSDSRAEERKRICWPNDPELHAFIRPFHGQRRVHQRHRTLVSLACGRTAGSLRDCPQVMRTRRSRARVRCRKQAADTRELRQDARRSFGEIRQPDPTYLLIPESVIEARAYIPIGFLQPKSSPAIVRSYVPDGDALPLSVCFRPRCTWHGCGKSAGG